MARGIRLPANFRPTHETAGLPGYGAVDNFAPGGSAVLSPANGVVRYVHQIPWSKSQRTGGYTMYLDTPHGSYFLTHFGNVAVKDGQRVQAGQPIGTVAAVPGGWWQSHIHEGFDPNNPSGGAGQSAAPSSQLAGAMMSGNVGMQQQQDPRMALLSYVIANNQALMNQSPRAAFKPF